MGVPGPQIQREWLLVALLASPPAPPQSFNPQSVPREESRRRPGPEPQRYCGCAVYLQILPRPPAPSQGCHRACGSGSQGSQGPGLFLAGQV